MRGAYLAMEPLVQALGTSWGLFRHYWVLFKLLINSLATVLLLVHMQVIAQVADAAAAADLSSGDHFGMRVQLPADAAAALLVLLAAVALSAFKPRGLTRYAWRKQQESRAAERPAVRDDRVAGVGVAQ